MANAYLFIQDQIKWDFWGKHLNLCVFPDTGTTIKLKTTSLTAFYLARQTYVSYGNGWIVR